MAMLKPKSQSGITIKRRKKTFPSGKLKGRSSIQRVLNLRLARQIPILRDTSINIAFKTKSFLISLRKIIISNIATDDPRRAVNKSAAVVQFE
jgi:hypothetical protein